MDDEIDAIERNDTQELIDLPKGYKTIGVKWVFKTQLKENGEVDKYKAYLVAKGYKQEYGVDCTNFFLQQQDMTQSYQLLHWQFKTLAYFSARCQISILAWILGGTSIC